MADLTTHEPQGRATALGGTRAGVRAIFIATICLSALLLFLIQPMFAKMALPLLGGAPNVWTTAMLFFQTMLLAGYAYAHWLSTRTGVRTQILTHLGVTLLASLCLPISIGAGWTPPTEGDATLWLLGLFTISLGAPFFALSANAPLLQKWYAATGRRDAADPYFLYAASNIGSFGALMAYPFILEPMFGAAGQSHLWAFGYFVLFAGLGICGMFALRGGMASQTVRPSARPDESTKPASREIAIWIGLAFVPSSLMLSVTAKIATDIGSFPLIWTVTLALYLLSYVFAFSERLRPSASIMRILSVAFILLNLSAALTGSFDLGNTTLLSLCAMLFIVSLACHATLAERRPAAVHLTRFYLAMSVGGALGGLFNSILSPLIFNDVHEYPIVLAIALLAAPGARFALREDLKNALPIAAIISIFALGVAVLRKAETVPDLTVWVPIGFFLAFAIGWFRYPLRQAILALALVAVSLSCASITDDRVKDRSFFGVYKIRDMHDRGIRRLIHGTTVHGAQRLSGDLLQPLSYYHVKAPLGQVTQARAKDASVAVVGLGAGALACYHRGAVDWTFYEIDPLVDRIARNPDHFTFMSECAADAPTLLGDARLRMAEAGKGAFDLIVLDAFSSDAVPVHLLTVEAMRMYRDKLADDGVLAIHISNRHYDLEGPVAHVAATLGMPIMIQKYRSTEKDRADGANTSHVLLMAKSDTAFGAFAADNRWSRAQSTDARVWTDDYANVLSALRH